MVAVIVFTNLFYIVFLSNFVSADHISNVIRSPSVEVRGVYLPCFQEQKKIRAVPNHQTNGRKRCSKKILISIKFINSEILDEFLVLNHVYEPITNISSQLLNPIVFIVNQDSITEVYDLKYHTRVNAEAKEEIKQTKRCSQSGYYPVCGSLHFRHCENCCCLCPSNETSDYNGELKKRSRQYQTNSDPFLITDDNIMLNSDSVKLLKTEDNPDLSSFSNGIEDVPLYERKIHYNTKSQLANDYDDRYSYFSKMGHRKEYQPMIGNMQQAKEDIRSMKSYAHFINHDGDRYNIQQASKLHEDVHDSFMEGSSDYQNGRSDTQEHKEKQFNLNIRREGVKNQNYDKESSSNQDLDKNKGGLQNSEKENFYEGSNLQSSNVQKVKEENVIASHKDNVFIIPSGKKLSKINIGLEYEKTEDRGDSEINHQDLPADRLKNSNAKKEKNKTCDAVFDLHCLTFSKQWYKVFGIKKPRIMHSIELEIFEKHINGEQTNDWIDHTEGKVLRVGSIDNGHKNQFDEYLHYKVLEKEENHSLNPKDQKLLVPEHPKEIDISNLHEMFDGNPGEFLVLPKNLLSLDGSKCDRAGVGVKAFISSKDRCTAEQGSCLGNQPATLWQKDKDAKDSGGKCQYFLEAFGKIPNNSLRAITDHTLQLDYNGKHISQIDVIVSVESNSVVRTGPVRITSVILDDTGEVPTLNVAVMNLGLGSITLMVELGECITSVASASKHASSLFSGHKSKKLIISSLHEADFTIDLCKEIPNEETRCIVLVKDGDNKTIAARRVTLEKGARCWCLWHCKCNCVHSDLNLKCELMPHNELLASGFKGTVPVVLPILPSNYLVAILEDKKMKLLPLYIILFLILLILLGLCKVVLGLTYWEEVWISGIPYYYCSNTTEKHQMNNFADCKAPYHKSGYTIHRNSKKRSYSKCKRLAEFFMNIFMFILLPFVYLTWLPIHMCCKALCDCCAGIQWKNSISKSAMDSNKTSTTSSFIPEVTEKTQIKSQEEDNLEGTPSKSKRRSSKEGSSSTTLPENEFIGIPQDSHISFVTYDGTSDEQEAKDVDYVMVQMRRSNIALQKAQDRPYLTSGGRKIFIAESIDEESSVSESPSSNDNESDPKELCIWERCTNEREDALRSRPVRDAATTIEDTLSEVTTKDSLEAVTASEEGFSSIAAQELVENLRSKKFIFRNIDRIIGEVQFPQGRPYSIRGFFFNAPGGYKFIPPSPLWQYWTLGEDGETMVQIDPPLNLSSAEFEKFYDSAQNVLDEADLSMLPLSTCINVQFQHFDDDEFLQEMGKDL